MSHLFYDTLWSITPFLGGARFHLQGTEHHIFKIMVFLQLVFIAPTSNLNIIELYWSVRLSVIGRYRVKVLRLSWVCRLGNVNEDATILIFILSVVSIVNTDVLQNFLHCS